jgi:hypothetical protein
MRAHFYQIFVRLHDDPSLATTVTAGKSSISRLKIPKAEMSRIFFGREEGKEKGEESREGSSRGGKKRCPKIYIHPVI